MGNYTVTAIAVLTLMLGCGLVGALFGYILDSDDRIPDTRELPEDEYWAIFRATVPVAAAQIPSTRRLSAASEARLIVRSS